MSITYSKAEKSDFSRINELFVEMLQTIYNTDDVNGYNEGDLDRFFDNRDEWACLASDEGRIVAFLSIEVHHEEEEFIYLDDMSVTKEYRSKGIGTELFSRAENYAREINIHNIYLHVEKSNTSAFRLYERLGYKIHEEQESRYLMSKSV